MKRIISALLGAAFAVGVSAAPAQGAPGTLGQMLGLRDTAKAPAEFSASAAVPYTPVFKLPQSQSDTSEGLRICGSVVYPDNVIGMWSYGVDSWDPVQMSKIIYATGGGLAAKDLYYCNTYREMMGLEEIKTYSYKLADWSEYDAYSGKIEYVATTMAYNKDRDEAFGCFINPERNGYNFVKWDYDRYLPKKIICAIERPWSGCAFSSDGTLYAIERNGDLYTVDTKTGVMTLVGSTGVPSTYLGDAIIDPATDTMYWSVTTDTDFGLYSVDIKTATAHKLYTMENEEQICGMYIPDNHAYADNVPAAVSSVNPSFSGANLSGTIRFTMPRYTFGPSGEQTRLPDDESLTYTIRANGKVITTGTELPGKSVAAEVEMTEPDSYNFVVTVSNSAGESPEKNAKKFVGPDEPQAPSSFTLSLDGANVKLAWRSPSSTGVNGGNVEYSKATYTVVRYPDGKVLLDNGPGYSLTDVIEMPEKRTEYYYTLTATVNGLTSAPVKSAVLALGPIDPPYEGTFTSAASLAGWTLIGNGDAASKWAYYSYEKALRAYNSAGFNDWAISPAVNVVAGSVYPFSISVKTTSYYEETFEVCWGTEPTAEAMTNVIIPDTKLKNSSYTAFTGDIAANVTGPVYIGIHAKTEERSSAICVSALSIGEGKADGAPAAVSDFKVTSPVDGTCEATVSFTTPATDIAGEALEGDKAITSVEILRDGKVIAILTDNLGNSVPMEYTDRDETLTTGTHTYGVAAVNAMGRGTVTEGEVLIGAHKPVAPASAVMIEEGNTGKVTISWEAVTTDVDGNEFKPDAVTYRVIDRNYNTVADNVTGTSITVQAVEEGEQAFVQFGVYAVTAGGESDKLTGTAYKPVGKPYETPWAESFAGRSVSSIFGYNYIKGSEPWQFVSTSDWGIAPSDEDGGFAYFEAYGVYTALVTGKISLEGVYNPAFTYYTYNYQMSSGVPTNAIVVEADEGDGRGFVKVQSNVVAETGPYNQWNKVVVSLADYEGKSVVLRIVPTDAALAFYTLDNLRVASHVESNLTASRIVAPLVADAGKEFEIEVTVANTGEQPVSSYTVELQRDGETVDFKDCGRLDATTSRAVTFTQVLNAIDGDAATYKAVIFSSSDLLEADNETTEVTVGIVSPAVPAVTDLSASVSGADIVLSWTRPDESTAPAEAFTEGFENAESWSSAVAGWKIVDMDKAPVGGIEVTNFPITGMASWAVADRQWTGFANNKTPEMWDAHQGFKFICSEYVQRGNSPVQSDDWAISPRLYGGPQALRFYAKSFDPAYLEAFEVLYSDNSTNTDDFKSVGSAIDVPNAWTQYRFMLPDGAKYFAIRSRSTNKFFLFIDDVTFIPADGTPAPVVLSGYNVYRNGNKVNSELITDATYTDRGVSADRTHSYYVTAVYDKGESRRSNEASVWVSGIGGIDAGAVSITARDGAIAVSGLADGEVAVYAVDGRTVAVAHCHNTVSIPVAAGIYVVKAAGVTAKVAVK